MCRRVDVAKRGTAARRLEKYKLAIQTLPAAILTRYLPAGIEPREAPSRQLASFPLSSLLSPPIHGIPLLAKVGYKVLECRIERLLPIHILGNLSVIDPVAFYNCILHTRGISN
jgi:hypothetical protein